MALTQTPANVGIASLATITRPVTVGEAVAQGQPGYRATSGKFMQADADVSQAAAEVECIFVTPGTGDGSIVIAVLRGPVILGATLVVGKAYYLSSNKGQIETEGDLTAGDWVTFLGIATSTTVLDFQPQPKRIQVPA